MNITFRGRQEKAFQSQTHYRSSRSPNAETERLKEQSEYGFSGRKMQSDNKDAAA